MSSPLVYFSDLEIGAPEVTVHAHLIDLQPPQKSANGEEYQRMIFQDSKGTKMNASLFRLDVGMYKPILRRGGLFKIFKPTVRFVNPDFATYPGEKQMTITNRTNVKEIDDGSTSTQAESAFVLSAIPRNADENARFDVVVVVLSVEDEKPIKTRRGASFQLREMVITDDSVDNAILVSAWNKIAMSKFVEMKDIMKSDPVIAISALKVSHFNGFSLATTLSSEVHFNPKSDRATALRNWLGANKCMPAGRLAALRSAPRESATTVISIAEALSKPGSSISYRDLFRISVRIPDFDSKDVKLTLGCSTCGRKCETCISVSEDFYCSYCRSDKSAEVKIYFRFKCTDGTGTLSLDAYTKNASKLFGLDSVVMYELKPEDRSIVYLNSATRFREQAIPMVIAPVMNLLTNHGIVKWILKEVLM